MISQILKLVFVTGILLMVLLCCRSQETDMMLIHQRPWDFDYFTSIYRSPIVSVKIYSVVIIM